MALLSVETYTGGCLFGSQDLLPQFIQLERNCGVDRTEFEALLGQMSHFTVQMFHVLPGFFNLRKENKLLVICCMIFIVTI